MITEKVHTNFGRTARMDGAHRYGGSGAKMDPRKKPANRLHEEDLEKAMRKLDSLEQEMDQAYSSAGKTIAELYRSVCTSALMLPNLELRTETMTVQNTDNGLTVIFHRDKKEEERLFGGFSSDEFNDDEAEDEDDDDEEEGLIYDGD